MISEPTKGSFPSPFNGASTDVSRANAPDARTSFNVARGASRGENERLDSPLISKFP
jgi:hypothetical protein